MSNLLIIIAVAVVAVGLFVLGLSITLIRKGHDLESDVGSNREMRRRGIECASAQIRREEAERLGRTCRAGATERAGAARERINVGKSEEMTRCGWASLRSVLWLILWI